MFKSVSSGAILSTFGDRILYITMSFFVCDIKQIYLFIHRYKLPYHCCVLAKWVDDIEY